MSNELLPFSSGGGLARDSRRAGRAIGRNRSVTEVRVERAACEEQVTIEKIQALTAAHGAGMTSATKLSQAQVQLELMSPNVAPRLAAMGDSHTLDVIDLLSDLQRKLRRI